MGLFNFMQAHLGAGSLSPMIRVALCILVQEKEEGNLCPASSQIGTENSSCIC